MKKLIAFLLTAVLLFSLAACGGEANTLSVTEEPVSSSAPSESVEHIHTEEIIPAVEATCTKKGLTEGKRCSECGEILVAQKTVAALGHTTENGTCERCGQSFGIWYTDFYVDDFDQPTDEWYIANNVLFEGTFSNSATDDAKLTARVVVDAIYISIFLYQYGTNTLKNSSQRYVDEYNITMRTGDGTDHQMTGTIFCGGDRICIDEPYVDEVLAALLGEDDVMFNIVKADRTVENYLLCVEVSNFADKYADMTATDNLDV